MENLLDVLKITTWARFDYFQSSNSVDDQGDLAGGTLQVKALPQINEIMDGKVEVRVTKPDIRNRPGYPAEVGLLESYLNLHFNHADLRVGKQIVAWGRADGINPTDNLTPRNFRVLLPTEDDQRFGTWAARVDTYLSQELTFTAFATPFFEPNKIPLPAGGTASHQPSHTIGNTEEGFKINRVSEEVDWSVSYYRGFSLSPSAITAGSRLDLDYDRVNVVGADYAQNFGRFGFRSEIAYTHPEDRAGVDPNLANDRIFWVLGVDRKFFENFSVNLQAFVHWMPRYQDPAGMDPVTRSIALLNSTIDGQQSRISPGMTFRVSDLWLNETLRAELLTLINFKRGDSYLRPLVTYDASDHVRVSIGANIYRGPRQTQYGVLRPDTGAFAELRYGF